MKIGFINDSSAHVGQKPAPEIEPQSPPEIPEQEVPIGVPETGPEEAPFDVPDEGPVEAPAEVPTGVPKEY